MTEYNILDFGAVGDGCTNDAPSIQKAIDTCASSGGGRVLVPSGRTFLSGSIELKSHVDFHLAPGAHLLASTDPNHYFDLTKEDKRRTWPCKVFIHARRASDISITGSGTINGSSEAFVTQSDPYHKTGPQELRPTMIYMEGCRHLTFKDFTVSNAPCWTLHPAGCEDVLIDSIRILNDLSLANSDGIDPDHCRNVRIVNCQIACADDCIVLKNTRDLKDYGPCENIVISGCILTSTSSAIKIGTESVGDFKNIVVDSCVITASNRGLTLQLRDEGNISDISFSNIMIETRRFHDVWWGKAEPIHVSLINRNAQTKAGQIKDIRFHHITCKSENGIFISGLTDNRPENIILEDIRIDIGRHSKWNGGMYDKRPCEGEGLIHAKNAGIFCENLNRLTIQDVRLNWRGETPEWYGSALECHHVDGLKLINFMGKACHNGQPDILLDEVKTSP